MYSHGYVFVCVCVRVRVRVRACACAAGQWRPPPDLPIRLPQSSGGRGEARSPPVAGLSPGSPPRAGRPPPRHRRPSRCPASHTHTHTHTPFSTARANVLALSSCPHLVFNVAFASGSNFLSFAELSSVCFDHTVCVALHYYNMCCWPGCFPNFTSDIRYFLWVMRVCVCMCVFCV